MRFSIQALRTAFKHAYYGTKTPTPEENRLFDCICRIAPARKELTQRLLPLLEEGDFVYKFRPKEPDAPFEMPEEDTMVWNFYLILQDKLQQKGWKTYHLEPGQDLVLHRILTRLCGGGFDNQPSSRLEFDMTIAGYKKYLVEKNALAFICKNITDLEDFVADLESMTSADITNKHLLIYAGQKSIRASEARVENLPRPQPPASPS